MKATVWYGRESLKVKNVPKPLVTEPTDCVVRVIYTSVCGSDLHLYHNEFSGLEKGDILGHEVLGIVEEVGSEVQDLQVGEKVVVSAIISCGKCEYCQQGLFSCCNTTNPSREMEKNYGHRIAGIFGYSRLLGGYDGGQAEFLRVPYASVNCLKIPESVSDEKAFLLSDVACTAWHACEMGQVKEGQTVAVWGCGPVGLLVLMWAKFRGAKKLYAIDAVDYRLDFAKSHFGDLVEIINFGDRDVIREMQRICPGGPDVCIDAAGFRFPKSLLHRLQRVLRLETDSPEILYESIKLVKKGGTISIVGDYYAAANGFPIGAFMEKSLTMKGGQVPVQRYWKQLLEYIQKGEVDPTFVITNKMKLDEAPIAYRMFDEKEEGVIKILLSP